MGDAHRASLWRRGAHPKRRLLQPIRPERRSAARPAEGHAAPGGAGSHRCADRAL